jgi:hypothetical protein
MATNNLIPRGGAKPSKSKTTAKDYFLLVCFIAAVVALFQNTALPAAQELIGSPSHSTASAGGQHHKTHVKPTKAKARHRLPRLRHHRHRLFRMRTHPVIRRIVTGQLPYGWRLPLFGAGRPNQ